MSESSTDVRLIQDGRPKCGVRVDWWGEIEQGWGLVGRARGWMGQGRGRVAREGDAFSGCEGASGSELGEEVKLRFA